MSALLLGLQATLVVELARLLQEPHHKHHQSKMIRLLPETMIKLCSVAMNGVAQKPTKSVTSSKWFGFDMHTDAVLGIAFSRASTLLQTRMSEDNFPQAPCACAFNSAGDES